MASTSPSAGPGVGGNSPDQTIGGDPRLRGEDVGREDRMLAAHPSPPRSAAGIRRGRGSKKPKKREMAGMESAASGPGVGGNSSDETAVVVVEDPRLRGEDLDREGRILAAEQSPRSRASKKSKNRQGLAFLAGMESTSSSSAGPAVVGEILLQKRVVPRSVAAGHAMVGEILLERRLVPRSASMAAGASKKRKIGKELPDSLFWAGMKSTSAAAAGPGPDDLSLESIAVVGDSLHKVLAGLNATAPVRIYGKLLSKSDRLLDQSRLLMSCKKWEHGLDDVLTAVEKQMIETQMKVEMKAYDRDGRPYELACKKLNCNDAYRLIAGWGKFLKANNLYVETKAKPKELEPAMVELWAFRSPELDVGVTDQEDDPLGLLVLHYLDGDVTHAQAAIDEIRASLPGGAVAAVDAPHEDDAVAAIGADGGGEAAQGEADAE